MSDNAKNKKVLVKWSIDYADEFNCPGFMVFDSKEQAEEKIALVVEKSKGDWDWMYFGTNEAVGDIQKRDFSITPITDKQAEMLNLLFNSSGVSGEAYFGMLTEMFSNAQEEDDDEN